MTEKALRHNAGKIKMSYAPACLSRAAARGFQYGAEFKPNPYPRDNWRKGFPFSDVINSFTRHLDAWREGEDIDPETAEAGHPLNHLDLMACNLAMLIDMVERGVGVDDRSRFKKTPKDYGLDGPQSPPAAPAPEAPPYRPVTGIPEELPPLPESFVPVQVH
ncbi:hypothetical protein IZ6_24810 [Terrihabitans soli]|uniref:dATP/dGTP diphosphohydrolase N-terminal domain-containing protein n=1 Tax=Terrihabitans soli TaxID=708113 RepID=A0A6S6QQD5_9HYPH|nr:dATP/dGTP diphosphohydrolase domain-containing protein [Terrihabitans soli]BCJ91746.1 hypothetical protein IZ6_24810 [Terrihabitans soli]